MCNLQKRCAWGFHNLSAADFEKGRYETKPRKQL